MICPYCGNDNIDEAVFCEMCGKRLPEVQVKEEQVRPVNVCLFCGEPLEEDAVFCGNCGAQVADTGGKQVNDDRCNVCTRIRTVMIRRNTGEKIIIEKYPFVIGRQQACDYTIMNNPAIGRQHIKIDCLNQNIYITDLGSPNHTFVGGKQITGTEELHTGMEIKLADESFDIVIYSE